MSATIILDKDEQPYTDSNRLPVDAELTVGDISIGAVEIKDADSNTRANVTVDSEGDNRLLVDAGVTSVEPNELVGECDHDNIDTVKASYTVPAGKTLFITFAWASTNTADIVAQLQIDDVPELSLPVSSGANSFASVSLEVSVPLGPYTAGTVIEFERVSGLSGLPWSAGWRGFLK